MKMKTGFLVALATTLGLMTIGVGSANAAQRIDLSVTDSWYIEGVGNEDVGPYMGTISQDPGGDPVEMSSALNADGTFTFPGDKFEIRPINPTFQTIGVENAYRTTGDLTGTYSAASGAMTLKVPMAYVIKADKIPGSPSLGKVSCEVSGIDAVFQTSGSVPAMPFNFAGKPFSGGNGQLLGTWSLPMATFLNNMRAIDGTSPADCQSDAPAEEIDGKSFSGKAWLRADLALVDVPSVEMEFKTKRVKVKAGKSASLKLRVRNIAGSRTTVKIDLKSSNPNVKVKKSINVTIPAGSVYLTDIKVKANKKAKGKAKITASAEGRTTVSTVTVKRPG